MDNLSRLARTYEHKKDKFSAAIWKQVQPLLGQTDLVSINELSDILNEHRIPFLTKRTWDARKTSDMVDSLVRQGLIRPETVLYPLTDFKDIKEFNQTMWATVAEMTEGKPYPLAQIVKTLNTDQIKYHDGRDWNMEKLTDTSKHWARDGQAKLLKQDGKPCLQTFEKMNGHTRKANQFAETIAPVIKSITKGYDYPSHKLAWLMNRNDIKSPHGKQWHASNAQAVINRCKKLGLLD